MMESPKSLTAVVHVKFHYGEPETKSASEDEVEMMSRILDRVSDLPPEKQELFVKFAEYLNHLADK